MPKETFFNLSEDKRARIETVAIEEFAENSLNSASVNTIVSKAGIAKGSFYQYFENLEDLYQHILKIAQKRKLGLISSLPSPSGNMDTFRYLQRLLLVDLAFELNYPRLSQVERRHKFENPITSSIDPETGQRFSGDGRFHAFLSQGSCQMETVLYRDRWVGDCVPEKDRACILGNLVLKAHQGA